MAAHENKVEETIVHRIKMAFSSEQKDGKISSEKLLVLRTRLFDYAENEGEAVDNSHFFPETIRQILSAQITETLTQITAIHLPEFYQENNFKKIVPSEELLKEIQAIFLDQDGKVKSCYLDAFGGEEKIKALFRDIDFRNVQGISVGKDTDPLDKFKDFLINAYYDHYKQELGIELETAAMAIDPESPKYISKKLWQGWSMVQLEETEPVAYGNYKNLVSSPQHESSRMTMPETASLKELLEGDLERLMAESDEIHNAVLKQRPLFSSPNHSSFFGSSRCDSPLVHEKNPLPESVTTSEKEQGCTLS